LPYTNTLDSFLTGNWAVVDGAASSDVVDTEDGFSSGSLAASDVVDTEDGFSSGSLAQLLVDGQLTSPTIQLARHHAAAPRAAATFLYRSTIMHIHFRTLDCSVL